MGLNGGTGIGNKELHEKAEGTDSNAALPEFMGGKRIWYEIS